MATSSVPGATPANRDHLVVGCWAEHEDGSLVFVEGLENGKVIYSMFDMQQDPIVEYRDAMLHQGFEDTFSWDKSRAGSIKWSWHDKTPFPWHKVIKQGAKDGTRFASAYDHLSSAARVAESLNLKSHAFKPADHTHQAEVEEVGPKGRSIINKIQGALNELRN